MTVSLAEAALVLGCHKSAVSKIRSGSYPQSELVQRYQALERLIEAQRRAAALDSGTICNACPRQSCTGCRVAELVA